MNNYRNLLLAFGITISSAEIAAAKEASLLEDKEETSFIARKAPSPVFLEIDVTEEGSQDASNVGCSVSNSGCK